MKTASLENLYHAVRDVPDFPKPGILFKDITPLLANPEWAQCAFDAMLDAIDGRKVDKVAGIDARGFIFASVLADRLGAGFVPLRKEGKLPYTTKKQTYALEYGEAVLEVHEDAIVPGEKILLVDDLLATGGTASAAIALLKKLGGELVAATFLIELKFLNGREKLGDVPMESVLAYP